MTNNPTIDGVSRELLANFIEYSSPISSTDQQWHRDKQALRALLDAPVVERQPVAIVDEGDEGLFIDFIYGEDGNPLRRGDVLYETAPEVAALQSTIAQLQARIAELESARGEPVCQWSDDDGISWCDGNIQSLQSARENGWKTRVLYSDHGSQKYDDVLLPFLSLMRAELHANSYKGDRQGWLQMDRKTAVLEVFYHLGKLHQAVHRDEAAAIKEYAADVANMCMMLLDVCACLDATAALNEVKP